MLSRLDGKENSTSTMTQTCYVRVKIFPKPFYMPLAENQDMIWGNHGKRFLVSYVRTIYSYIRSYLQFETNMGVHKIKDNGQKDQYGIIFYYVSTSVSFPSSILHLILKSHNKLINEMIFWNFQTIIKNTSLKSLLFL